MRRLDLRILAAVSALPVLSGCVVGTEGATPFGPIRDPALTATHPALTYTAETRRQIAGFMLARSSAPYRSPWLFGPVALLDRRSTPDLPVYAGEQLYCVAVPDGSGTMTALAGFHVRYSRGSPVVTPSWGAPVCTGPAVPFYELETLSLAGTTPRI